LKSKFPPRFILTSKKMTINLLGLLVCFIFFFSGSQTRAVDRRFIAPYNPNDQRIKFRPSVGTILEGIRTGSLSFDYARWQWYQNREPFLEVAYWIGPNVGTLPSRGDEQTLRLDQYRGSSGGATGMPDQWVVMHFHFNHVDRRLFIKNPENSEVRWSM